ncbi:hypothetical protein D3C81_1018530 [compost metagenome]
MPKINHVNIADEQNRVYCRKTYGVVVLDENHTENMCKKCPMFTGSAQGDGVECSWLDVRAINNPQVVTDPHLEKDQIFIAEATKADKKLTIDK